MELEWNLEPGSVVVADNKELLIVSADNFNLNLVGVGNIDYMLVNRKTGELEACIEKEDLEDLWRYYDIKDIIKRKDDKD